MRLFVTVELAVLAQWCLLILTSYVSGSGVMRAFGFLSLQRRTAAVWYGMLLLVASLTAANLTSGLRVIGPLVVLALFILGAILLLTHRVVRRESNQPRRARSRVSIAGSTVVVVTVALIATVSSTTVTPTNYDTWLYHATSIGYLRELPTVVGLANLHDRLGIQSGTFVIAATGPRIPGVPSWLQLVNGFLVVILALDCCRKVAGFFRTGRFGIDDAVILTGGVYVLIVVAGNSSEYMSSPSPDTGAAITQVVATAFVARFAATRRPTDFSLALLTGVLAMYFRLSSVAIVGILLVLALLLDRGSFRLQTERRPALLGIATAAVAAAILLGREIALTGYPLYPLAQIRIPLPWTVPLDVVQNLNRWIESWAKAPGQSPEVVLSSNDWFGPWYAEFRDSSMFRIAIALVILGSVAFLLSALRLQAPTRDWRRTLLSSAAVLAAPVTLTALWFELAPALRFGWGALGSLAAASAVLLINGGAERRRRRTTWLGRWSIACAVAIVIYATMVLGTSIFEGPRLPTAPTPESSFKLPTFPQDDWHSANGFALTRPTTGDQCGSSLWCTPYPTDSLTVRKVGIWFVVEETRAVPR